MTGSRSCRSACSVKVAWDAGSTPCAAIGGCHSIWGPYISGEGPPIQVVSCLTLDSPMVL